MLLIADEIQTGLGRTGKMFACQHEGVRPDITVIGKALGGGFYPVSAALADRWLLGLFEPGEHGSTFGGNPLACVAALTTLAIIEEEGLLKGADRIGTKIRDGLAANLAGTSGIRTIRGKGLMIGVELDQPCGELVQRGLESGLLINVTAETVIRLLPPLNLKDDEVQMLIDRLSGIIKSFLDANVAAAAPT